MKVTEIKSENLEDCANLFAEVFNLPPWNESWTSCQATERLEFYFNTPNFIGLCTHNGNKITGFIFGNYEPYQNEYLYLLKEMCVCPTLQRTGVGSVLIDDLHSLLKSRNISVVNLITEANSQAEDFYLNNGYYKSKRMGLYVSKLST